MKKMVVQYPTDAQRRLFDKMLYYALVEMRTLAREGRLEQADDLADTFHNLPILIHADDFSFVSFRQNLETYHRKYPYDEERCMFDYLEMYRKVLVSEDF
jgi:hypothetical protein